MDWRLFAAASVIALVVTLAIGLAPAWKVGRRDLAPWARDGADQGRSGTRVRQWLVAGQIAGCGVLLVVAGQMWQGFERALANGRTYDISRLVVLEPTPTSPEGAGVRQTFWPVARSLVDAMSEVERTTLVAAPPLAQITSTTSYAVAPEAPFQVLRVDPGFFSTMGLPLLSGRPFQSGDDPSTTVIVSRLGALAVYGTTDVVGRRFPSDNSKSTVIGVAADASLARFPTPNLFQLYLPLAAARAGAIVVRARGELAPLVAPLRSAARAVDARVIPQVRLLEDDLGNALQRRRLASVIAALTAALALGLALLGVFGVVAFGVRQRIKEIGIRIALGASARAVLAVLLRHTFASAAIGLALGLALGAPAGAMFAGPPHFLQGLDVLTYVLVAALVVATGGVAALTPAWRAIRNDPLRALRQS